MLILTLISFFSSFLISQAVIVEIENGRIRGKTATTVGQKKSYYAFTRIPYAEAPIGNLRFEPPQPIRNWDGVLDTVNELTPCWQTWEGEDPKGDEDCLFLNVYTPSLPDVKTRSLRPVMVWIHGGTFERGSGSYKEFAPDYFLDEGVVFVTLNYRLGFLGFISLGDVAVPGNAGLKDQNLALKWVKKNIINFGGNPNHITLFGQSAGSASVSFHLQSPLSRGLFNRVILQSGTSLCQFSQSIVAQELAKSVAEKFKIKNKSPAAILEELKKIDAPTLYQKSMEAYNETKAKNSEKDGLMFAPVIEPKHDGAFISDMSYELLSSGNFTKVPIMLGFTSLEWPMDITATLRLYLLGLDILPSKFVPNNMHIKNLLTKTSTGVKIKIHYFGVAPVALSDEKLLRYVSDDQFNRPIMKFTQIVSSYVPTYLYKFSYQGRLGGTENRTIPGVQHTEDVGYLFHKNIAANETDALTRARMIKLWTNFAIFQNPTPTEDELFQNQIWTPIDSKDKNVNYLSIDNDVLMSKNPDPNFEFWDNLYQKNGVPPFNTY